MHELTLKDLAPLAGVSEETLAGWVKEGSFPGKIENGAFRFSDREVRRWFSNHHRCLPPDWLSGSGGTSICLPELISRGGILRNIAGNNVSEVIRAAGGCMPIPEGFEREAVVRALLEREELTPTAVGKGIALPHPRSPILKDATLEQVTIVFLEKPVDYHAVDGQEVHTLMVLLSSDFKRHLEILSRISYLCQQKEFLDLLQMRASSERLLNTIARLETGWDRLHPGF